MHDGTAAHAASKRGLGMDYIRHQRALDYSKAALTVKNLRAFERSDEAAPRRHQRPRGSPYNGEGAVPRNREMAISPTEMPWIGATVHTGLHHAQLVLIQLAKLQPEGQACPLPRCKLRENRRQVDALML